MDRPIYLRIAPELRRSAYYVLASAVPLALVGFCVFRFARNESVASAAFFSGLVLIFVPCMTITVPLRWSLRIDKEGIARRRLFRWDLWTWADFSSGRIEKRSHWILFDPQRPWWRRRLQLGFMAPADISRTMKLINAHYRLPAAPKLPAAVVIKYGTFFRRSVRFDSKGIHVQGPNEAREYLWSEVRRVHITRLDPLRRDFSSLEIVLPDREIELTRNRQRNALSSNWRGATEETINEVLERHAPAARIEKDVRGERPARRSDLEKQLATARKIVRNFRRCLLIIVLLVVVSFIWMAVAESVLKALFTAGLLAVFYGPIWWGFQREFRSCCLKLEQQLASFDRTDCSGECPAHEATDEQCTRVRLT